MKPSEQQREKIQDDLRGLLDGDVRCDEILRQVFASDGSIYEIKPLGVVRPRTVSDVAATLEYAQDKAIPIHPRGAGTGMAGESIGPGLIVDFSAYLHHIINTEEDTVRVQAGVAWERLSEHLSPLGRRFGPISSYGNATTIGGMIGVNAAGSYWPEHGATAKHVRHMRVVLAEGTVIPVGLEPLVHHRSDSPDPVKRRLIDRLVSIFRKYEKQIAAYESKTAVNRCGYRFSEILTENRFDLIRLLVGSEGTLALVTEATLDTLPIPRHRGVALLCFDSLDKASHAVLDIAPLSPSACDLLDRRYLSLAVEADPTRAGLIPEDTEAVLVVEQQGNRQGEVRDRLREMIDKLQETHRLSFGAVRTFEQHEIRQVWGLAQRIQPPLVRLEGASRPVPVVEDMAVPPEQLPEFLVKVQNILKRHELTATLSCHALQGQLHLEPLLNLADPIHVARMRAVADELYREVLDIQGTISGEHGCGLSRTTYVRQQYGPLYPLMEEIKQAFDPEHILNPGKVVGPDRSDRMVENLRPTIVLPAAPPKETGASTLTGASTPEELGGRSYSRHLRKLAHHIKNVEPIRSQSMDQVERPPLRDMLELQLNWEPSRVDRVTHACTNCGECRSRAPRKRMCPVFRARALEEASPRAKAALIRAVLTGSMPLARLTDDHFKAVADLCFHCHMCEMDCPSGVDIPRLMMEGKGAYVAAKGLKFQELVTAHIETISMISGILPELSNWMMRNRQLRWLVEKTLGIAQGRKLPQLQSRSFSRRAAKRRLTKPRQDGDKKVAFFVDTYVERHDPMLGEALLALLKHHNIPVFVPPNQVGAATSAIAAGSLDRARRFARRNVTVLAEAVRRGYQIIATEPAAVLSLVREYPTLLGEYDAELIAENITEACSFFRDLHDEGKLRLDLNPMNHTIAYHMPCRLKSLRVGSPGETLLDLIPGLAVIPLEAGCCGMAGTFGLRKLNYRTSIRIGRKLIATMRDPMIDLGATECSACKMQMEQGTTKPTIHPLKLLAYAYGLMPELEKSLTKKGGNLVVS